MNPRIASVVLICTLLVATSFGQQPQSPPAEPPAQVDEPQKIAPPQEVDQSDKIEIAEVDITGKINDRDLELALDFTIDTKLPRYRILIMQGDVVLKKSDRTPTDYRLDYNPAEKAYYLSWTRTGRYHVKETFVARPKLDSGGGDNPWQEASLTVPSGRMRNVRLTSDRPDLEVQLPDAMRVKRSTEQGQLAIEAILGPSQPLIVQWKPKVKLADAKLVLSSKANTIVDVRAGLLRLDALFDFQITQGKIETLTFEVPVGLSITALDGPGIRNWALSDAQDKARNLVVELSTPQEKDYRLRIRAETAVEKLPAEVEVPVIKPAAGMRASGHLAVGTDSALQLVVLQSTGLTQIDAAAFPRVNVDGLQARAVPAAKAFFYSYAGSHYQMKLSVDDVVSSYDVSARLIATIKEDDLVVSAELELDVRDAPLRQIEIIVPAGLVVASVDGEQVEDYHLPQSPVQNKPTTVRTIFAKPVTGRTIVHLRLELGHGPLGQAQSISAIDVTGAKTHRGYIVIAAETGIEIDDPQVENMREVHTASVPMRVAQAQFAYRFRQPDWKLTLLAQSKSASMRAEVFHLQSVGEALSYGSAVINYIITGSPVDELRFSLPDTLENVEFVGSDVRRWNNQDGVWVVKLTRKVIGDYNLAVTYTQQYNSAKPIQLGALHCLDVQTQTGFVAITSHLDLKLKIEPPDNADSHGLLPIDMDELPADYRLLTSSPILAVYKYVTDPHVALLTITPYQRSELLPVILDIAAHRTRLAVRPDRRIESVTTVSYRIKNTTGQFLSLTLPPSARVWSVSLVEPGPQPNTEQKTRLAASYEEATGKLLIPLVRKNNPNDPSTIELEYGQVHNAKGFWSRQLDLTAPRSSVPITYAEWHVTAPNEWAITSAGGNMQAQSSPATRPGLSILLNAIGRLWTKSVERWLMDPVIWVICGLLLVAAVGLAIFFRRWLPDMLLMVLLVALLWLGVGAAMSGRIQAPAAPTSLSFAQAVNADPAQALQISTAVTPAWRQAIASMDMLLTAASVIAGFAVVVLRRRLWPLATALILAASLYLAARIPDAWPVLEALMTWAPPAVVTILVVLGLLSRYRPRTATAPAPAMASLILLTVAILGVSGGCTDGALTFAPASDRSMIESIHCDLIAGPDNIELRYKLRISAKEPAEFPLISESAVLISSPKPDPHVTIKIERAWHTISLDRSGVYELQATFLAPLPAKNSNYQHRFELPLPVALTNTTTLSIPDTNVLIDAPLAVHMARTVDDKHTAVEAMFKPGQTAVFTWQPKEREASQEQVRFYAQDIALAHVASGLVQVFHSVRLQIAQGQIDTLKMNIAGDHAVTSVVAADIGSWRFDPAAHQLDIRLMRPATGAYELVLVTQSASATVPYQVALEPLVVTDALNQHSIMALAADPSVYVRLEKQPASMNTRDFIRDADELIKKLPALSPEQITQAFRFDSPGGAITGEVLAVQSELRSTEIARFNAEDDRLVYNSQWLIEIAKAGQFDIVLVIPDGYDIDTLVAEQVSHWDESVESGQRRIRVHFKNKLTGSLKLNLALSQPVAQITERLTVPRVMLIGELKHTGSLVIGSERGVRLSVASRQGVSEVNPAELGETAPDLLAFKLLRPDWQLDLQTELIQPRVTVQSLHVAKVTDGLVRHDQYLRYKLFHAGIKSFDLTLPADATGITITGPGIARHEQLTGNVWHVELADKVYDQPYLLTVSYETQYDQNKGTVDLVPIRCGGVDLQQGHTVVFATDRVELSVDSQDPEMRPAEARSIPKYFGTGDLSGAVMCYRSTSPDHVLTVNARRHTAAEQIGADVRQTAIATVVTPSGQVIHRVTLTIRVGTRRHLQAILPQDGTIWSLSVDGQAAQPSIRKNAKGEDVLLVPLPQQTSNDAVVDLVYIARLPAQSAAGDFSGRHSLSGPRFDLPLKQITWSLYVPEEFDYDDFGGTLTIDRNALSRKLADYSVQSYEKQLVESNRDNEFIAQQQQKLARELAQQGRQYDARRALSIGYNFSKGNQALSEDIRVDLDNLVKQQAKVGLVNARNRLRQQVSGATQAPAEQIIESQGRDINFSQQRAQQIESSLAQPDSENLELITQRIIQTQEAAEGSVAQLQVNMPYSGRVLRFDSPLQVEPEAEMTVAFRAKSPRIRRVDPSLAGALGLFAGLLVVTGTGSFLQRRWSILHDFLTPKPRPRQPDEPEHTDENPNDEPDAPVSTDELI
jgi:hypothetical protein